MARPKRKFTDEQVAEIEKYALAGCQNNTIATLMDIPIHTLTRHYGKFLTKKRCERKYKLRLAQDLLVNTNVAMAIFLGKNELGQTDKQEVKHGVTEELGSLLGLIDGSTKGKLPDQDESEDAGQ